MQPVGAALDVRQQAAGFEIRAPLIDHADGHGAVQNPTFLRPLKRTLDMDTKTRNGCCPSGQQKTPFDFSWP